MAKTWKRWTEPEIARLRQLVEQTDPALTYTEIAERMGRSWRSVKHGVFYHLGASGQRRATMCGEPWSREDYDRLELLLEQGLTYEQIAAEMGRTYTQVRGATERIGLRDPNRRGRNRRIIPEAERIIRDCIEVERMTVPQIVERLAAHGHHVSRHWVHSRIQEKGQGLRKELKRNATERRARLRTLQARRQRAQRQQQEAHA